MVEGYAAAHGAGLVPEGLAGHSVAEAIERYRREVLPRKGQGTQQSYDGHLRWWRRRLASLTPKPTQSPRNHHAILMFRKLKLITLSAKSSVRLL